MSQGPLSVEFSLRGAFFLPRNMPHEPEILNLGGYQFELALLHDFIATKEALDRTNWNAITASLTVRGLQEHEIPSIEEIVRRICWLLSLAGGALVAFDQREIKGGPTNLPLTCIQAIIETKKPFTPPIELGEPGTAKTWLEASYSPFVINEKDYLLRNVIHMLCLADAEHNLTIQALLVASTLEMLRHSFAQNVLVPSKRAIAKKQRFYKPNGKEVLFFEDILNSLARELKITACSPAPLVGFRNRIVHEGQIAGNSMDEQHLSIMEAMHFCHVIVLALLEWDKAGGRYVPATATRFGPRNFVR